jgi:hypothetical protein
MALRGRSGTSWRANHLSGVMVSVPPAGRSANGIAIRCWPLAVPAFVTVTVPVDPVDFGVVL